jgi:hypothetical protein
MRSPCCVCLSLLIFFFLVFCAVHVVSEESKRLVLPRTYCLCDHFRFLLVRWVMRRPMMGLECTVEIPVTKWGWKLKPTKCVWASLLAKYYQGYENKEDEMCKVREGDYRIFVGKPKGEEFSVLGRIMCYLFIAASFRVLYHTFLLSSRLSCDLIDLGRSRCMGRFGPPPRIQSSCDLRDQRKRNWLYTILHLAVQCNRLWPLG